MITAFLLVAASLLQWRERDAQRALPAADAARVHAYEALATCAPLPLSPDTALYVAEQQRGARLGAAARENTIWSTIDALDLRGNVSDTSVVWPAGERWGDEAPIVAPLVRTCSDKLEVDTWKAEDQALQLAGDADPVVAYEKRRVAFVLGRFSDVPTVGSDPSAQLLALEHRFALGQRTADMRAAYGALAEKLPAARDNLLVRQLQLAAGDSAALTALGEAEVEAPLVQHYRLALWVSAQKQDDAAIIAGVSESPLALAASDNAELVRSRLRDAASRVPFTRQTLAALEAACGKGRLTHEVYRVATLAASRHNLATAKDAYAWILTHGKAMSGDTHTKLALVAMLTLDVPALTQELARVTELPNAERQLGQLVTAVRSGGVRDAKIIATLRAAIASAHKTLAAPVITSLCGELDAASRAKTLHLVLGDDQAAREPVAPPVHFDFPEPYALIPAL